MNVTYITKIRFICLKIMSNFSTKNVVTCIYSNSLMFYKRNKLVRWNKY